ncbi:DUF6382 domain-containing protein [Konateibacter massiliensis]|uniref:DUF6382 domain-containing protein n=1 Tax=Konateibacter massiliensis TaxID=2002841 RepID=UPI000C160624|nr:DUF6382 domain-containing protein [Konateibacter massiliensis]
MNREFKRDLNNNYMILSDEAAGLVEDYRMRMLISNEIPAILRCNVRKLDGVVKYFYEITSKQPLARIYEKKKIGETELNVIITSFLKVIENSEEYLLNPNDFVLEPDVIYMNIETSRIYFCYMPGYEHDISESFHALTAYILERINHEDKHAVATAYELYRQTMNENYSLKDILNSIASDEGQENEEGKEDIAESETELKRGKRIEKGSKIERSNKIEGGRKIVTEPAYLDTEERQENDASQEKERSKKLYAMGGIVIVTALALLSYFLYQNREVISDLKLSNDIFLKIGGVLLITAVLTGYMFYKKYEAKKEEQEESLIVMEEEEKRGRTVAVEPNWVLKRETGAAASQNVTRYSQMESEGSLISETVIRNFQPESEAESYGNTVLLACRQPRHKLSPSKEKYPSFELSEKAFLIGKMEEHVDGVIQNESISRIHAEIKKDEGSYYLTDLNSTNGTFHNGKRLEANETVEIFPEDTLHFAAVEYVFQ